MYVQEGIATLRCPRSMTCFTGNSSANLERFFEKIPGKHEIITVQQDIKTREIRNLFHQCYRKIERILQISGREQFYWTKMPGEAHVYFTAFSSGRKALIMFCVK